MPSTASDLHLSDVHLHCPGSTSAADEVSRFAFSTDSAETSATAADSDGDQVLKRRRAGRSGTLKLRHALATPLPDVGLQVWRGALLLCDYLLARPALVRGATILELGAGCGLCGLLAAGTARRVFVTDNAEGVLANAQANVELNGVEAVARVRMLDWAEPVLPSDPTEEEDALPSAECHPAGDAEAGAPSAGARPAAAGPFAWSAEERAELRECNLILAADCVYGGEMALTLTLTLATSLDADLTLHPTLSLAQALCRRRHDRRAGGLPARAAAHAAARRGGARRHGEAHQLLPRQPHRVRAGGRALRARARGSRARVAAGASQLLCSGFRGLRARQGARVVASHGRARRGWRWY